MANKNSKHPKNVAGSCYVDDTCIGCGICQDRLPSCFGRDPDSDIMFVSKQPDASEQEAFKDAKDNCPVEAIGIDG